MSILKEDLVRHLFWKKITPAYSDYYKEVKIAIFEFLNGYPYDPEETNSNPQHVIDRVALEALHFTKKAKKRLTDLSNAKVVKDNSSQRFISESITKEFTMAQKLYVILVVKVFAI